MLGRVHRDDERGIAPQPEGLAVIGFAQRPRLDDATLRAERVPAIAIVAEPACIVAVHDRAAVEAAIARRSRESLQCHRRPIIA